MKVDIQKEVSRLCLGLVLYCLLISNTFANVIDTIEYDDVLVVDAAVTNDTSASQHHGLSSITQTTETVQNKDYASANFIKKDGKLFFKMRDEQIVASEYSAIALFLLGFVGLFLRRWP